MDDKINQNNKQRQASEKIILQQIDQIYGVKTQPTQNNPEPITKPEPAPNQTNDGANLNWQTYHDAWQNYYQQYYEYYYQQQLQHQQITQKTNQTSQEPIPSLDSSTNPTANLADHKTEIVKDLKKQLQSKMVEKAQAARKSRHFWPLAVAVSVAGIFLFLQYNNVLIGKARAYITPADTAPSTVIVDPTVNIGVGPESKLIIPKINVNVPVTYDVKNDSASQLSAMKNGVTHFAVPGASSHPGEIGNTAISGHSSNDFFDKGDYKFIFAQLDKLNQNDTIYADYKGVRYTYSVLKKEVVWPNEWKKLVYPTTKPILTLITCTPVGTTKQRLLVTAEQISPDPGTTAVKPTVPTIQIEKQSMPGQSPTLLEKLFGKK